MMCPFLLPPRNGHRNILGSEQVEIRLRRAQRKVRGNEADDKTPRAILAFALRVQPFRCHVGDSSVEADVITFPGAGIQNLVTVIRSRWHLSAQQAIKITYSLYHVHRNTLIGKAVRIVSAAIVQLPDCCDLMAVLGKAMTEAWSFGANVRGSVVPSTYLMSISSRCHAPARRHANRRLATTASELRTSRCQSVQMRSSRELIAIASKNQRVCWSDKNRTRRSSDSWMLLLIIVFCCTLSYKDIHLSPSLADLNAASTTRTDVRASSNEQAGALPVRSACRKSSVVPPGVESAGIVSVAPSRFSSTPATTRSAR